MVTNRVFANAQVNEPSISTRMLYFSKFDEEVNQINKSSHSGLRE